MSIEQKIKRAKLMGSLYFIILGTVNFGATLLNGKFRWLDLIIFSLALLPLLVNKRAFFIIFGVIAGFISLYIGFAGLLFNLNPNVTGTSQMAFVMGYLLAASSLISSILLIYAGSQSDNVLPELGEDSLSKAA